MIRYSIIIVTYNSENYIEDCVKSIEAASKDHEIIIVDNNSRDGTKKQIETIEAKIDCLFLENNMGFAWACNAGAAMAQGEYLIFLNPDTVVFKQWLQKMELVFTLDEKVGAVGPVSNYVAGYQKSSIYAHIKPADLNPIETKLLIGFCLMIRRDVFNKFKFDEALFLGNEDLDLSWRLRLAGYRLVVATMVFILQRFLQVVGIANKRRTGKDRSWRKLN